MSNTTFCGQSPHGHHYILKFFFYLLTHIEYNHVIKNLDQDSVVLYGYDLSTKIFRDTKISVITYICIEYF
jgi:hypothetical protein